MINEITKLKTEIDKLQAENCELKERLIDYQRFVKAINAQRAINALEEWFNDDEEDE